MNITSKLFLAFIILIALTNVASAHVEYTRIYDLTNGTEITTSVSGTVDAYEFFGENTTSAYLIHPSNYYWYANTSGWDDVYLVSTFSNYYSTSLYMGDSDSTTDPRYSNMYLIPTSETVVSLTFELGMHPTSWNVSETKITIKGVVDGSLVELASGLFGELNRWSYTALYGKPIKVVVSYGSDVFEYGYYTPVSSETITVNVDTSLSPSSFMSFHDVSWSYDQERVEFDNSGTVFNGTDIDANITLTFNYLDDGNETDNITAYYYVGSGTYNITLAMLPSGITTVSEGDEIYNTTVNGSTVEINFRFWCNDTDIPIRIVWYANRTSEDVNSSYWYTSTTSNVESLPDGVKTFVALVLIVLSVLVFAPVNAGVGGIVGTVMTALMSWFGWIDIGGIVILVMALLSVLAIKWRWS